ncbi:class I SAM-dependent methyltransferase [Gallaecimonas kandeliae]|uniref:class I SAM-dependent methyltransferase n=1 Tax=Gallaecimonas kandeliae TaxID=3029055 RepID=UPI002647F8C9|nr:class I SAM-dependent methyltransferase [Gallaecimonas kandeliae]WKE66332.1 class I SAM-dependent methyltransferase [Gallaecimonas kandeliae]
MKKNSASSTAYTVLQGLLHTAGQERFKTFIDEETKETAKLILANTEEGRRRLRQLANPASLLLLKTMEKAMLPGISAHYALRKHFIERQVINRLTEGTTQIVNLGAGFDTLAWRLHRRYPGVTFIEIDHPATNAEKRDALSQAGQPAANLHLIAADLAEQSLAEVLGDFAGFERARETLFICEGVLMYLEADAVQSLFASLKALTDSKPHLVFTAAAPFASAESQVGWLLKLYLKVRGEPLKWSISKADIGPFLQDQGYELADLADGPEMNTRFLDQPLANPHRGEFAVACRVSP